MTEMTLDYLKHVEQARHNEETEQQGRDTIAENKRHNVKTEGIQEYTAQEGHRHNVQTEKQAVNELAEKARSNRVNESIRRTEAFTNQNKLMEMARHNLMDESIRSDANRIKSEGNQLDWNKAVLNANSIDTPLLKINPYAIKTTFNKAFGSGDNLGIEFEGE